MKKQTVTFIFDILLVRKYKKQILLANIACLPLIPLYYWIQQVRDDRALRRRYPLTES